MQRFSAPAAPHGAAQRGAHLAPARGSLRQCPGQSGGCQTGPATCPPLSAANRCYTGSSRSSKRCPGKAKVEITFPRI